MCGPANGVAVDIAPSVGLCSAGTQSTPVGTGPWTWSCAGLDGGTTASCDAPLLSVNGVCGASNGTTVASAPTGNLCSAGNPTGVAGAGPWTWSCVGLGGGTTASCTASSTTVPPGSTCGAGPSTTSAYYVNCSLGSGGTGTSSSPFGSLAQAQSAMESSSTKTAIVSGTCTLASDWNFSSADNGETWQTACGQAATISGNNVNSILVVANNLTFYGFTFQNFANGMNDGAINLDEPTGFTFRWNTMVNCVNACLSGGVVLSSMIDSNIFNGMEASGTEDGLPSGAIWLWNGSSNNTISHNLIENDNSWGIAIVTGSTGPPMSNNVLDSNLIEGACQTTSDCGALYLGDFSAASTGNKITNNAVIGNGSAANSTKCIYFDAGTSNVVASGNICASSSSQVSGQYDVFFHGGSNNQVTNNILEVQTMDYTDVWGNSNNGTYAVGYESDYDGINSSANNIAMTGNSFENNIVYTSSGWTSPLFFVWDISSAQSPLTVENNDYYSATGAAISNPGATNIIPSYATPANVSISNPASMLTGQGPLPNPY